jgi:hypothetical protein
MPDVFLSYSRKDADFVRRLVGALEAQGRDVWVDFEDIPFATDWWDEIEKGIDASPVFVFVISPDSIQSQVCSLEVAHALETNKRIIPIVCRDANMYNVDTQTFAVPKFIRSLNWIFFNEPNDFNEAFAKLTQTMDTDIDRERQLTRLLVMAREWENKGRSEGFLLFGDRLLEMEALASTAGVTLNDLQRDYVYISGQRYRMRQMLARFGWGFAGGAAGMVFFVLNTFRGATFLTPLSMSLSVAAGEVFGVLLGAMSVLAHGLPESMARVFASRLRAPLRVAGVVLFGVLAWMVFQWLFLGLPFGLTWGAGLAGLGMAVGFLLPIFLKIRASAEYVLTAIFTYLPIYAFNSQSPILEQINAGRDFSNAISPLIYFDDPSHPFLIGLPMALLIALATVTPGALAEVLRRLRDTVLVRMIPRPHETPSTP